MASEFIGYSVIVSLKAPPGGKLQGQVANVVGQNLLLQNVTLLWNGQRFPSYSVDAAGITDLSLQEAKAPFSHPHDMSQENLRAQPAQTKPPQQNFVDPAILSYSKVPTKPLTQSHLAPRATGQASAQVAASLSEPFSNLELNVNTGNGGLRGSSQETEFQAAQTLTPTKKSNKRNRSGNESGIISKHGGAASTNPKSKGWRQTAFVEPMGAAAQASPEHIVRQPGAKLRKKKASRAYVEDQSGWATEDATDIQELGEFDFASNLSKFDKRRVFEEIRNDDTTADEARLVSFNRLPKPGTNDGKNLHWSENVLDSPQNSDTEDVEGISDARHSSENISGRDRSRAPGWIQTSRKSSAILSQPVLPQINVLGRSQLNASRTTSPHPGRSSVSPMVGSNASGASLRLITTNRSCPTVSPLQALEVEQIAVAEFGLSEDVITENAGRGIAEAAVALLSSDAAAPTIVIVTGNHRTGARAIAAARHLRNRGHRVTVCLLGLEYESELLESCRKQLDIFRKIGGRVSKWEDLSPRLSTSDLSPDLVIDALFGMHIAFDDLRTDDQGVAFEMISWVNRSNLEVLSVDIPSGMSASNGDTTTVDGGKLCVNGSSVVCLAAPKTGVLNALLSGEGHSWNVSVADIGIPQIVWRKYGTRRRHGIDFGNRWVVPLRYQAAVV
ncbi:hypothetical protein N7490_000836 [Penicillium lividum]|nr:hypothetical protein N7490_000836 [Penicillium lividum]